MEGPFRENIERNKEITIKILQGEKYEDIAKDYNLSSARIREIVFKAIRTMCKKFYLENFTQENRLNLTTNLLRSKKDYLIPLIHNYEKKPKKISIKEEVDLKTLAKTMKKALNKELAEQKTSFEVTYCRTNLTSITVDLLFYLKQK